jgi:HAD superfamily hydrolase (TIGR01509 family)
MTRPILEPVQLETVKGVLFDMDGTLAVNAHHHHDAWIETMRERYGFEVAPDEPRVHGGKTKGIMESLLGREISFEEAAEFHEYKEARYRQIARGRLEPVAGLFEYLQFLRTHGIPVALVTSADLTNTLFVLEDFKLETIFQVRVLGSEVRNGKPHPEPFLTGASKLGLEPEACLAHEDAPIGVRSAATAGTRVVGMATLQPAETLREAGASWVVPDYLAWLEVIKGG